jgi:hypothetical protein
MSGMARAFASTAMAFAAISMAALPPAGSAQPADPGASPAFRPCDWVTVAETSDILGKPVFPTPSGDQVGSNAPQCFYAVTGDQTGLGISAELILPGGSPGYANIRLANAAEAPGAQTVAGLGINAVCVYEPNVTPPSTTIVVQLDGDRIFRSTAAYEFCDTVERFARIAVDRITT